MDRLIIRSSGDPVFETAVGIPLIKRFNIIDELNLVVANLSNLNSMVKECHWNIKGESFIAIHKLLDEVWNSLNEYLDSIAERIVALGGLAKGSNTKSSIASNIPDINLMYKQGDIIEALSARLSLLSNSLYKVIPLMEELEDPVTSNMLQELAEAIDKWLWLLSSNKSL